MPPRLLTCHPDPTQLSLNSHHPQPPAALQPQVYPAKKKVVDDYVIILACVLGGLLVLPLLAWLGRRMWLAHQHRKVGGLWEEVAAACC